MDTDRKKTERTEPGSVDTAIGRKLPVGYGVQLIAACHRAGVALRIEVIKSA